MEKSTRREFVVRGGSVAAALSLGQVPASREASAATASFEVSIDILGLNALVIDRATRRTEVLLVDPPALGLGMPRHTPFLVADLRDITNPVEDSKPTTVIAVPAAGGAGVKQVGLWDLSDSQVVVRRPGGSEITDGLTLNEGRVDPARSPEDADSAEAWRDLRYVADLQEICGQGVIAPGLSSLDFDSRQSQPRVPEMIRGRVRLASGVLEGAIPSQEIHRRALFQFTHQDGRPPVRQPLTDTVRWKLSSDTAGTGNYVTLDLVPLRDTGQGTRSLMLSRQGRVCRLSISNMPTQSEANARAHHGLSDEEMAAHHFGAYYKLLANEPRDKPLPRRWHAPSERGAGLSGTTMCPPSRFILNLLGFPS